MSQADKLPVDTHGRLDLGKPQTHLDNTLSREEIAEYAYQYGWSDYLGTVQHDCSMALNQAIRDNQPALCQRLREELVACLECKRSLKRLRRDNE